MRALAAAMSLLLVPAAGCAQPATPAAQAERFETAHKRLMERIRGYARGIGERDDPRVMAAMADVRRHLFVPESQRREAYDDHPLPIGHEQTISQPSLVALMTHLMRPQPDDRVLEVGTGSGYQAAILSGLVDRLYSIEIVEPLAREAEDRLERLGYDNVEVREGDGYLGWPEAAPFDSIIVTAGAEEVPQPLIEQLKPGGRMLIPVGPRYRTQQLRLIEKDEAGKVSEQVISLVRFVPLTREDER